MSEEQRLLVEKAKKSLQAAQLLSESDMYGFAASRAYYSMFYVAQAFLLGESLTFSSHSAVISAFGKTFSKTKRLPEKFHRYLINAAVTRTEGDYDHKTQVTADKALNIIEQAQEFIDLASQM